MIKIFNISLKDPRQQKEIDGIVGASFSWMERIKRGGIGSPRSFMTECSPAIASHMKSNTYRNACNVELRPKGVIIRFRSMLDTYALVIPYRSLTIYQNGGQWSFHAAGEFIKMQPESDSRSNRSFMLKLMALRAAQDAVLV